MSWLRIFRVMRVVRVVRRLNSLRTIIAALRNAAMPVLNAFCLLAVVGGIFSVFAVQVYGSISMRAGFGYFDTFSQSLGTLFQVASGDSWIVTVVRPLNQVLKEAAESGEGEDISWTVWPFFISYYITTSVVLFNVIVAILLDELILATSADKFSRRNTCPDNMQPLDLVLSIISAFSGPSELDKSIHMLFNLFDIEDQGFISFDQFREGLERMQHESDQPAVHVSVEDWDGLTEGGQLCDENGHLKLEGFECMLRRQLCIFSLRRAATSMQDSDHSQVCVCVFICARACLRACVSI